MGFHFNNTAPSARAMTCAFLASALLQSVCSSAIANDQAASADQTSEAVATTPRKVSVEDVVDDLSIATRLTDIFEASGWFREVAVTSKHGFVQITGVADSDARKDWAGEIATRTTDVIGVKNGLTVESRLNFGEAMMVVGESLEKQYRELLARFPFLIAGVCVLILTWIVARLFSFAFVRFVDSREKLRSSLKDLLRQLSSTAIWAFGVLVAITVVFPGMTPAKALTVLGLGSVAIGFAFKDIFENFFAGVLILWRYPIEKGDFVECGDVMGRVEEITIRNTMLRRTDGGLAVVPNAQLFKSNVDVLTNRPKRRVRIICGVAYGESGDEAREVIRDAVASCESVSGPKSVEIFANEFADSSVNFEIAWWTGATPLEIRRSRDEVIASVKSALDKARIEIPFPYRTLTFPQPLTLHHEKSDVPEQSLEVNGATV